MKHKGVTMKGIEIIRKRVVAGQVRELTSLRAFISGIDGNAHVVERLRETSGQQILAAVTDCIMNQLGAPTAEAGTASNRSFRRAARGAGKAMKGRKLEEIDGQPKAP